MINLTEPAHRVSVSFGKAARVEKLGRVIKGRRGRGTEGEAEEACVFGLPPLCYDTLSRINELSTA